MDFVWGSDTTLYHVKKLPNYIGNHIGVYVCIFFSSISMSSFLPREVHGIKCLGLRLILQPSWHCSQKSRCAKNSYYVTCWFTEESTIPPNLNKRFTEYP